MMIEFYVDVFASYIKLLVQNWREFNLTEIEVFKSILSVYRPISIDRQERILNYDLQTLITTIKQNCTDPQFVPLISDEFWT